MLALLGKTVTLMDSLGFLWLVHSGFELGLWEELQGEKSKEEILSEHSNWSPLLMANPWGMDRDSYGHAGSGFFSAL